jgi:hypothetical protein
MVTSLSLPSAQRNKNSISHPGETYPFPHHSGWASNPDNLRGATPKNHGCKNTGLLNGAVQFPLRDSTFERLIRRRWYPLGYILEDPTFARPVCGDSPILGGEMRSEMPQYRRNG